MRPLPREDGRKEKSLDCIFHLRELCRRDAGEINNDPGCRGNFYANIYRSLDRQSTDAYETLKEKPERSAEERRRRKRK